MATDSILSSDGTRIVYDQTGQGPAILLLHGGGESRLRWHQCGYVDRLKDDFTVITMDIRGHGESDKPVDPDFYSIDRLCEDILGVADACRVDQFMLWGFSYGGNIGRFLASRTDRVSKLVMMGIPFGLAASGDFRQFILDLKDHWAPHIEAHLAGSLDLASLSPEDRQRWQQMDVPAFVAWLTAMLSWGGNEPGDLRCPTLWLVGTGNKPAFAGIEAYEGKLEGTNVRTFIAEGLTHQQEFEEIELVFPIMLEFTKSG